MTRRALGFVAVLSLLPHLSYLPFMMLLFGWKETREYIQDLDLHWND